MHAWETFSKNLFHQLEKSQTDDLYIGFSGGVDSVVLTNACLLACDSLSVARPKLIHVMHSPSNINAEMALWCKNFAHEKKLTCHIIAPPEESCDSENAMRVHRYKSFQNHITSGTLLLAHHLQDQCETALFNFIRGCSLSGISGIPHQRNLGDIKISRPLLGFSKAMILAFAEQNNLTYFEDPSNQSRTFTRNYIRHELIPIIQKHWPHYEKRILHTCHQAQGAQSYIKEQVAARLKIIASSQWLKLDPSENSWFAGELVRTWLTDAKLEHTQIITLIEKCHQSANGIHTINKQSFYFHAGVIFRINQPLKPFEVAIEPPMQQWHHTSSLGTTLMTLNGQKKSLKKIFQDLSIPPWLRKVVPVIQRDNTLVAIPFFYTHPSYPEVQKNIEQQCPSWLREYAMAFAE